MIAGLIVGAVVVAAMVTAPKVPEHDRPLHLDHRSHLYLDGHTGKVVIGDTP